ncbi:MAG TPA: protein kinase, partial [Actinomycetota bacterium]|nr:protein kinase [Actinomycetota bacterium]
ALGVDIAECLASVHDVRIVHRDVKPSNILFRSLSKERQEGLRREGKAPATERTLLGDFGIARRLEGVLGPTKVVGSPQYMAPEQADPDRARLVDQRGDLYSAGVVMKELLGGGRSDVPRSLNEAIDRALAADPVDRFPSAWEWRDALLRSLEEDEPAAAAAPSVGERPSPHAVATAPGATRPAATRQHTLVLDQPAAATRPDPVPRPAAAAAERAIRLRPHAVAMLAAGLTLLVALFVPVSSIRSLSGVAVDSGSVSVTAAWVASASALVLLLAGLELWHAKRRWLARLAAVLALLAGLAALAVAGWVAVAVLTAAGESGPRAGLYVLTAGAGVGAMAGSAASRRLRPPLAVTAPATGR